MSMCILYDYALGVILHLEEKQGPSENILCNMTICFSG